MFLDLAPLYQPHHVGQSPELSTGDRQGRRRQESDPDQAEEEGHEDENAPSQRWGPAGPICREVCHKKRQRDQQTGRLRPSTPGTREPHHKEIGQVE